MLHEKCPCRMIDGQEKRKENDLHIRVGVKHVFGLLWLYFYFKRVTPCFQSHTHISTTGTEYFDNVIAHTHKKKKMRWVTVAQTIIQHQRT